MWLGTGLVLAWAAGTPNAFADSIAQAADPDGPIAAFVSEDRPEYTQALKAFQRSLRGIPKARGVRVYSLANLDPRGAAAEALLASARAVRPSVYVCFGQRAFYLLFLHRAKDRIPVIFSSLSDAFTDLIRDRQKNGEMTKFSGVAWGDFRAALDTLRRIKDDEIVKGARRVGVLFSKESQALVGTLLQIGAPMGLVVDAALITKSDQIGPTIRRLSKRVDVFLVLKRDRFGSDFKTREKLFQIATAERQLPVLSLHAQDLERGAVGTVEIDAERTGQVVAELYGALLRKAFGKAEIWDAKRSLFRRRFQKERAKGLRGVSEPKNHWEIVGD